MARLITDYASSRFMKKDDVNTPKILTIAEVRDENVAPEGQKPEVKPVAHWREDEKPLILNMTNMRRIAGINGSPDMDLWAGTKVEAFNDVGVSYQGHQGAVRVQAPRSISRTVEQAAGLDDDLPPSWGSAS